MKEYKSRCIGWRWVLLLILGLLVALPMLMVWRARREERLSAQLLMTVKNVLARAEPRPVYGEEDLAAFPPDQQQEIRQAEADRQREIHQGEQTVVRLLQEGADPNVRDFPSVHRAFWAEVRFLLKRMLPPPPASASLSRSALSLAVEAQDALIVQALLKAGADDVNAEIEGRRGERSSLVHYAAHQGNLEIVQALCAHRADVRKPALGAENQRVSILLTVLDCDLDYTDTATMSIDRTMETQRKARTEIFHLLQTKGVHCEPKTPEGYRLLCMATKGDFREVARELLAAGVAPNDEAGRSEDAWDDNVYSPLDHAVANDDVALATLLLEHGARIRDAHTETPAVLMRSPEMAQLLLAHGADLHAGFRYGKRVGENALSFAAMRGDTRLILFLLQHGFDVNAGEEMGNPITEAAEYADAKTVRLLLEHGAKVGSGSPGADALWLALAESNSESAKLLLAHGAAVNAKENAPLSVAADQDDFEIAQELVERGADVNAEQGAALLSACISCDEDLVGLLLEHGANPNVRFEGSTAMQLAKENADPPEDADDIIAILKKYGAKK